MTEGRVRAFLAVEVGPAIHSALVELKRELAQTRRRGALGARRRAARDGEVPRRGPRSAAAGAVRGALRRRARRDGAHDRGGARPRRVPAPRGGRASCGSGSTVPRSPRLAAAVDAALAPLGFATQTRPFHAHITLGRVNAVRGWALLDAALRAHGTSDYGTCALDRAGRLPQRLAPRRRGVYEAVDDPVRRLDQ